MAVKPKKKPTSPKPKKKPSARKQVASGARKAGVNAKQSRKHMNDFMKSRKKK